MKFIRQLSVIMVISFAAELMEFLIPLPIAASAYGLVLMLIGLITRIIPLEKVEGAADFLIEIMPVLFVPPTVSLIANAEALKQMLVPLFVISSVTTVLIMVVTGRVTQGIMRHDCKKQDGTRQLSAVKTVSEETGKRNMKPEERADAKTGQQADEMRERQ